MTMTYRIEPASSCDVSICFLVFCTLNCPGTICWYRLKGHRPGCGKLFYIMFRTGFPMGFPYLGAGYWTVYLTLSNSVPPYWLDPLVIIAIV